MRALGPVTGALLAALLACLLGAPSPASAKVAWLCDPALRASPCAGTPETTLVDAAGRRSVQLAAALRPPAVDCFYVYPTVTFGTAANAPLEVQPPIVEAARSQASRFSPFCRVYAPLYRQLSPTAVGAALASPAAGPAAIAYGDVRDAWRSYLAKRNRGRGVVLIGHSQGAAALIRLLREEIDPKAAVRRRLVSALLLGGDLAVARGKDVGGDFRNIPLCRRAGQIGCAVAYSSFLSPPSASTGFGRPGGILARVFATGRPKDPATLSVACTNPAALAGGSAALHPYFLEDGRWLGYPGRYTARCETRDGTTVLRVRPHGGGDQRPVVSEGLGPLGGLHLFDVNIALGDLVATVGAQARAFARRG